MMHEQEILFYSIPTEKEVAAGVKPEMMKRFNSGHLEPVTKILLFDVDKVGKRFAEGTRTMLIIATCLVLVPV